MLTDIGNMSYLKDRFSRKKGLATSKNATTDFRQACSLVKNLLVIIKPLALRIIRDIISGRGDKSNKGEPKLKAVMSRSAKGLPLMDHPV